MTELSPRHARFVEEYLVDLNGTQAAIRAGYSTDNARCTAYDLLRRDDVSDAIAAAQAERSKRTKIDADWVLRRLADEVEADVADLYDEAGALLPVKQWPLIWRKGLVAGFEVEEIRVEGAVIGTIRKVRLSDRVKRIEMIGRHVGVQAFKDRVDHGLTPEATEAITSLMTAKEAAEQYRAELG